MTESLPPEPLVFGPYELIERVASGGMAEVYVARRQGPHGFHKTVAVKRILPQLAQDPEFVAMFVDEARVAATLSHPNIVHVFDFGEQAGELYMAMEYVRGTNAARLVRRAAGRGEVIPLDVCLHIVLSVLRGLAYAHGAKDEAGQLLRLVHRDVSPGNVLVDDSGAVKLTDFGIARAANFERRTAVGHLKGKLGYMSPEQVLGFELDARSDLFTLGIVLAELLTLRPLFSAHSELEVLTRTRDANIETLDETGLPPDVDAVLRRALARLPDDRYPTAAAFAEDVEALARRRNLSLGAPRLAAWMARLERDSHAPDLPPESGVPEVHEARTSVHTEVPPLAEWEDERTTPPVGVYRVQRVDGTILGPLRYQDLAELFATGFANAACLVARNEGPFESATSLPELAQFVTRSALAWDSDGIWSARSRRDVDRARLPGWLFRLAVARKTGAILLRDGPRRKKIFLVNGVPEFVSSTDKRELLGEHLIGKGRVARGDVEMALSILPRFGGRLGDALVGLGLLRPVELFRAIHEQTVDRYLELFRWREGEVAFDDGAASGEETVPLGIDPLDLVARGVRESYDTAEILGWLDALGDDLVAPVPSPPLRTDALRWAAGEAPVLAALSTPRPLRSFLGEQVTAGHSGLDDTLRGVFLGLSFGVLATPRFEVPDSFV
jgi:serine/threonine-protein kinase